jgi:hypothetical protein
MIDAPADYHQTENAPDARRRLAEIARQQAELAAEAQRLIAALAGEPERAADHDAGADNPAGGTINFDDLETIPCAAADYGVTDKTLRRWARKHGAIVHIGGRVYVDTVILSRSVISRKVPNFSLPTEAQSPETAKQENRDQI